MGGERQSPRHGGERGMLLLPPCVGPTSYSSDSSDSGQDAHENSEEEEEEGHEVEMRAFGTKWRAWSVPRELDSR